MEEKISRRKSVSNLFGNITLKITGSSNGGSATLEPRPKSPRPSISRPKSPRPSISRPFFNKTNKDEINARRMSMPASAFTATAKWKGINRCLLMGANFLTSLF